MFIPTDTDMEVLRYFFTAVGSGLIVGILIYIFRAFLFGNT